MKRVLIIAGLVLAAAVVLTCVVSYVRAARSVIQRMKVDDTVVHGGYDIVNSIDAFVKQHGHAPESLNDLVPATLPALPQIEFVDRIEYQNSDNPAVWSLRLYSTTARGLRVYLFTSTGELPADEVGGHFGLVHGWFVSDEVPQNAQ